jgi:hypothetical protein
MNKTMAIKKEKK